MLQRKKRVVAVILSSLFFELLIALFAINNQVRATTFESLSQIKPAPVADSVIQPPAPEILISQYDPIIREIAQREGIDWRLISAIAYAESRFQSEVRSHAGAIGLMQVMPRVARSQGYTVEQALNPQTNVEIAINVIRAIEGSLRLNGVSEKERVKIILAGYNSGIGNLLNSRRAAYDAGVNHNSWEQLKEFGRVNNPETRGFVDKVISRWDYYCTIA